MWVTQVSLMALMPTVINEYCMLQSRGAPQTFTLSKEDRQHFDGDGGVWAFMVYFVRSTTRMVIFNTFRLFPLMVCFNSSCSEFWSSKVPGGKRVFIFRGALRRFQARLRGKRLSHPSQTRSVCISCSLAQAFCLSIALFVVFVVSMAIHSLLNMVRQGGRRRPRGHHGDGSRPTASSSDNPEHSPANLPLSHANVQPSSPARRPIPNSAFQTTHFKLQSNLNKPLISAHITIILSEEENQIHPLACIAPEPSLSSEQQLTVGSQEKDLVDQPDHIDSPRIILPHVENFPAVGDGILNDTNHPMSIPEDDMADNEALCLVSDCPAEEKTPGGDKEA